ncbi:MAG: HPP family protein [Phycisphaerae bacterium]|nr:HPP family protein [Phycisphaerae bacterium]
MAAMFVVLGGLCAISNVTVIAALGASTFIAFTMPQHRVARVRYLVGGYVIGTIAGTLAWWLMHITPLPQQVWAIDNYPHAVFGATAVGVAIFAMVVTNTAHPPAAGVALGITVMEQWSWLTPVVVLGGILGLCGAKALLRPLLRDLL